MEGRLRHQDDLEEALSARTRQFEPFALMDRLQAAAVPAGVCQNAEDRVEHDPQLAHLNWMRELSQQSIGEWPVRDLPFSLSHTPTAIGGELNRHGPDYAQDNEYVFGEILGLATREIKSLEEDHVI